MATELEKQQHLLLLAIVRRLEIHHEEGGTIGKAWIEGARAVLEESETAESQGWAVTS